MRALCVAGARPNFMKIKPVLDGLEAVGAETVLVHTGQHYDHRMSDVFFDELGIRTPDCCLDIGAGTHAETTAAVMLALEPVVDDVRPDVVVVVGDVNSTLAAALVGAKAGSLVAHVEAGLRSRDWTMPEEVNRVATDRVSDLLLAPSADAVANLSAEGYRPDQVHLVGNVMVDTLLANLDRARTRPVITDLGLDERAYALVTLHRPGNVDDAASLDSLMGALEEIAERLPVVFPVHPRTQRRLEALPDRSRITLIEPQGYLDFVALEAGAAVVLTDSGGVQEETTVLGIPCLTLRTTTERPITITEGTNRLIGPDPRAIVANVDAVLRDGVPRRRPAHWDGRAGERIAEVLIDAVAGGHRRPTER